MRSRSPALTFVAFGLFGLSALSARSAFADSTSCATDADCVKGWACQVTGASGCAYGCPEGQTCSPPPDCVTQETKSCVPGPCKADSDCATGMVCYTTQTSGCDSAPACPPGSNCPTPSCAPTTQSSCIPRYDAPCKADADCGAGFSCLADSTGCACANAGSAPSADGGTPEPIPPTTCDCPAATTSSCHALPVTCTTAADCAAGWTCEDVVAPTTCVSEPTQPPKQSADGGAPTPASTPAQDAGVDPCPPAAPAMKMCLPPYYSLGGGTLGVSSGTGETNGGGTTTSTGQAGGSGTAGSGTPATPTASDTAGKTSTAAGCSVAHGSSGGASALLLLALGLFGFARRRRATPSV
jgi:MYXO-CTERM domain-containing protein